MTLRTGSMFSGYGGLDMAVNAFYGAETVWHVEYDEAPSKILAHHWPNVPNYGDVTQIDWTTMPPIDILTGGFPCQPFSAAGRRAGENDERHLWPYVMDAIRALRPKFVVLENVAGLRSIGGYFDEPTLRCVCGWAGRRGRVHYSEVDEVRDWHGDSRADWDVDESWSDSLKDAGHVRRHADNPDTEGRNTLAHHDVDRERINSGHVSSGDRAAPDPQGRAGDDRVEDRRDPYVAGTDRNAGSLPLDHGVDAAVRSPETKAQRAERAWEGIIADGEDAVCPACGGPVGDGPGGSIFRSGLGTVYRDLAGIGLHARWTSIRASDVGAPHHRERLFILVTPADSPGVGPGERVEPFVGGVPSATRGGGADDAADSAGVGLEAGEQPVGQPTEITEHHSGRYALPDSDRQRRDGWGATPEQEDRTHTPTDRHSVGIDWGAYAPAVRRWERVTRSAPAPTELNSNGRPRLNAAFAEWMMGLPAGWVTDPAIGLSRAQQLKAIGNGVCPPQAFRALQILHNINLEEAAS